MHAQRNVHVHDAHYFTSLARLYGGVLHAASEGHYFDEAKKISTAIESIALKTICMRSVEALTEAPQLVSP